MRTIIHFVYSLHGGVANVALNLITANLKNGDKALLVYCDDSVISIDEFFMNVTYRIESVKTTKKHIYGSTMFFGMDMHKIYIQYKSKYPNEEVLIHAHNVQTIGLFTNINGIPMVCTLHGISNINSCNTRSKVSSLIYKRILLKLIKSNKSILAVSEFVSNYYCKLIGKNGICVVHNGVDIKPRSNFEKRKFTIAHIGDISFSKGWHITCDAYKNLPIEIMQKVTFVIAGNLIDISEKVMKEIVEMQPVYSDIKYLGHINNAAAEIMPNIDVLIMASKNEGFGMVLIEALANGKPIIGLNSGGISEVIVDNCNGYLVVDSEQITSKIVKIYNDVELYNQLSENALKDYQERFTSEVMFANYSSYYTEQMMINGSASNGG